MKPDEETNSCRGEEKKISAPDSKAEVWVIQTNKELVYKTKEKPRTMIRKQTAKGKAGAMCFKWGMKWFWKRDEKGR